MGLPLRSPVAKRSCEAATEENAKRRSFMPRTQVTGKANFSPGITSGLLVIQARSLETPQSVVLLAGGSAMLLPTRQFISSRISSGSIIHATNGSYKRDKTGAVRDRRAARLGRDGRGVPCAGHAPWPHRRRQDPS